MNPNVNTPIQKTLETLAAKDAEIDELKQERNKLLDEINELKQETADWRSAKCIAEGKETARALELIDVMKERDELLKVREVGNTLADAAEFAAQLIGNEEGIIDVVLKNSGRETVWDNGIDELQECEAKTAIKILELVKIYRGA